MDDGTQQTTTDSAENNVFFRMAQHQQQQAVHPATTLPAPGAGAPATPATPGAQTSGDNAQNNVFFRMAQNGGQLPSNTSGETQDEPMSFSKVMHDGAQLGIGVGKSIMSGISTINQAAETELRALMNPTA